MTKSWEPLRAEIERVVSEKNIQPTDFRALGIYDGWQNIEEKIYFTFCDYKGLSNKNDWQERPVWLWEYFKLNTFSISSDFSNSYKYLSQLVDKDESVWFFVNGSWDKFWFYEGKIDSITSVIEECYCMDELHVASKKYKWIISINHHDMVFATGEIMPDKLRSIATSRGIDLL